MASDSKPISSLKSKLKIDNSSKKKSLEISSSSSSIKNSVNRSTTTSSSSIKNSVNRSTTTSSSKLTKKTSKPGSKAARKTREKKVYSLPGQKFDAPEEREPLRIFYESLSKQIPSSEMAEFWLMEHGLLSPERAKKAYEKKQKKQKQLRMGTPIKSPQTRVSTKPAPSNKGESSQKVQQQVSKNNDVNKAKKRIRDDTDDDDDDFVLSHKRRK